MAIKIIETKKNQSQNNKKTNKNTKNKKSNQIIIQRKTSTPKIIIETPTKKEYWLFNIIKNFSKILIWGIPFFLIGGGIYWSLFKFFPDFYHQIHALTGDVAIKTKSLYDKTTQPLRQVIENVYNKITGNDKDPLSPPAKLGCYLTTTLSVIGICLGVGKMGNWFKKGKKPALKKGTKAIIPQRATSFSGKILKISSKVLGLVSLAATTYELYQFYREETQIPNPPQPLTQQIKNPPTLDLPTEKTKITNPDEAKETKITNHDEVTTPKESETGNRNNP
ncbi:hypothetical protein OC683_02215 ['Crotalaria aegyptiaca' phytoplasma]|uniref:Uncharacterized protein n=1 Tax=Candidatus Phytoplasma crotalariae TaxID=2982627 RepID=A0ABT9D324_9MOLU|nr:hypothetical protein ['Crotalaria aegyptiaca' phytoplasma]MDO8059408.1 hypothetical protein ['Crotalaria aegyptiaca' phytoplasma]